MRAWEIKNWQDKKLRRACWNKSLYCSFTPNRGWDSHCAGQVIDFDSNLQYFFGVMSENDIEEYVEPTKQCEDCATESKYCKDCPDKKEVKKDCHTCRNPCSWGQEGHPLNNAPCWAAKKEELTMEKSCDICKNRKAFESKCFECSRIIRTTDNFEPELPTKTKELTWNEAYEAWNDGWEVETMDNPPILHAGNKTVFDNTEHFMVVEILTFKYQLTGKRR